MEPFWWRKWCYRVEKPILKAVHHSIAALLLISSKSLKFDRSEERVGAGLLDLSISSHIQIQIIMITGHDMYAVLSTDEYCIYKIYAYCKFFEQSSLNAPPNSTWRNSCINGKSSSSSSGQTYRNIIRAYRLIHNSSMP